MKAQPPAQGHARVTAGFQAGGMDKNIAVVGHVGLVKAGDMADEGAVVEYSSPTKIAPPIRISAKPMLASRPTGLPGLAPLSSVKLNS